MTNPFSDKWEKRLQYILRHYAPNRINPESAWTKFAATHTINKTADFSMRYWLSTAACLLLLISTTTWIWYKKEANSWEVLQTGSGQITQLYLPDSTLITLAPHSQIRFNRKSYGQAQRRLELKGKAFFEVVRNAEAPFSVRTAMTSVTVLGTSFQINEQPEHVAVNVVTGKVRFEAGQENEGSVLSAGMSATYLPKQKQMLVEQEQTENRIAWKTKKLCFQNTPIEKVIQTLEEYYGCTIVMQKDPSKEPIRQAPKLTATFEELSLRETLSIINQTLQIRLTARPGSQFSH